MKIKIRQIIWYTICIFFLLSPITFINKNNGGCKKIVQSEIHEQKTTWLQTHAYTCVDGITENPNLLKYFNSTYRYGKYINLCVKKTYLPWNFNIENLNFAKIIKEMNYSDTNDHTTGKPGWDVCPTKLSLNEIIDAAESGIQWRDEIISSLNLSRDKCTTDFYVDYNSFFYIKQVNLKTKTLLNNEMNYHFIDENYNNCIFTDYKKMVNANITPNIIGCENRRYYSPNENSMNMAKVYKLDYIKIILINAPCLGTVVTTIGDFSNNGKFYFPTSNWNIKPSDFIFSDNKIGFSQFTSNVIDANGMSDLRKVIIDFYYETYKDSTNKIIKIKKSASLEDIINGNVQYSINNYFKITDIVSNEYSDDEIYIAPCKIY